MNWKDKVHTSTNKLSQTGCIALGSTLGVFLIWALLFPLSGAVVATGKVIGEGQNKVLQHPLGGVIKQILAKDGDILSKGDLIVIIEPNAAIATLAELEANRHYLLSAKSRLIASKHATVAEEPLFGINELRGVSFRKASIQDGAILIAVEQDAELNASTEKHQSELSALENQLAAFTSELIGVSDQIEQNKEISVLLNEQYSNIKSLEKNGHIAKTQVWDIQTRRLDLLARISSLRGNYNSLIGRVDETNDRIRALKASRQQENSRELTNILVELESIEERINAAKSVLQYSELRAPEAGTLTNVMFNTVGGVIDAGGVIAEIVPLNNSFQVEAKIMPADIKSVSGGSSARVVITAFNTRLKDPLDGIVDYVSADSQIDANTGEAFFTTRVSLDADEQTLKEISSGMYAQIFIETEARTFMSYVLRPITDSFRKAFNET